MRTNVPRTALLGIATILTLSLVLSFGPASAATAYVMEGGGTLTRTSGPGLAATGPSTTSVYTFATLPIVGHGELIGKAVAGSYNCPSSVTITGVGVNFTINWSFSCARTAGIGPSPINGSFAGKYPILHGSFTPYVNGSPIGTVNSTCSGAAAPIGVSSGHITKLEFVGFCVA